MTIESILSHVRPSLLNNVDSHKQTALHRAAWHAQFRAVVWLINNGLSVRDLNSHDQTPLHLTARRTPSNIKSKKRNFLAAIKILLKHGADKEVRSTDRNFTPYDYACEHDNWWHTDNADLEKVKALLKPAAKPNPDL